MLWKEKQSFKIWFGLAILILATIIFRLYDLEYRPFDGDEAFYIYDSKLIYDGFTIYTDFYESKPPLIFLLISGTFRLLGVGIAEARLPIAISSVLTTILIFLLACIFYRWKTGLLAGFLFSLTFDVFLFGSIIKTEVLATLFIVITLYLTIIGSKGQRKFYLILSGIFFSLGTLTRLDTVIILPVIIFIILMFRRSFKYAVKNIASLFSGSFPVWFSFLFFMGYLGFSPSEVLKMYTVTYLTDVRGIHSLSVKIANLLLFVKANIYLFCLPALSLLVLIIKPTKRASFSQIIHNYQVKGIFVMIIWIATYLIFYLFIYPKTWMSYLYPILVPLSILSSLSLLRAWHSLKRIPIAKMAVIILVTGLMTSTVASSFTIVAQRQNNIYPVQAQGDITNFYELSIYLGKVTKPNEEVLAFGENVIVPALSENYIILHNSKDIVLRAKIPQEISSRLKIPTAESILEASKISLRHVLLSEKDKKFLTHFAPDLLEFINNNFHEIAQYGNIKILERTDYVDNRLVNRFLSYDLKTGRMSVFLDIPGKYERLFYVIVDPQISESQTGLYKGLGANLNYWDIKSTSENSEMFEVVLSPQGVNATLRIQLYKERPCLSFIIDSDRPIRILIWDGGDRKYFSYYNDISIVSPDLGTFWSYGSGRSEIPSEDLGKSVLYISRTYKLYLKIEISDFDKIIVRDDKVRGIDIRANGTTTVSININVKP